MNTISCRTIAPFVRGEKPNSIMIFGRLARIKRHDTEQITELLTAKGYTVQCYAEDEHGNIYAIYTDYDACLISSDAVAIPC